MYINILIAVMLILIVYWKVRNQYFDRITTEFRYKLYDLRDKLRDLGFQENINCNDLSFKYLDSSISRTVNELYRVNIWTLFLFPGKLYRTYSYRKNRSRLTKSIFENEYSRFIYMEYGYLLLQYLTKRHYFLMAGFNLIHKLTSSKKGLNDPMHISEEFRFHPETSSIKEFCV